MFSLSTHLPTTGKYWDHAIHCITNSKDADVIVCDKFLSDDYLAHNTDNDCTGSNEWITGSVIADINKTKLIHLGMLCGVNHINCS